MTGRPLAFVTGAGSGIGRAAAIGLAAEHDVGLIGRDAAALSRTAELVAAEGGTGIAFPLDIADEPAVEAAYRALVAPGRRLKTIVASAGIQFVPDDRPAAELDRTTWDRTVATNLTGMFLTFKYGIPFLREGGGGSIVAVGSPNALQSRLEPWSTAYNSSKAGTHALARSLAIQLAPDGIRVNVVVPGFIATPMNRQILTDPSALAELSASVPLGRPGTSEEVADAIVFLASDRASYITGSYLFVDGGMTA